MTDFILFNAYEGIFWIALAFVCGFVVMRGVPRDYRFLGAYTTVTLFVFGITDFLENLVGGFWYKSQWLFLLKALCVIGLVVSIVWYVRLRRRA